MYHLFADSMESYVEDEPHINLITAISNVDMAMELMQSLFHTKLEEAGAKVDKNKLDPEVTAVSNLDGKQSVTVVNTWGHLVGAKATLENLTRGVFRKRDGSELNQLCLDEIYRLRHQLMRESKKNSLLRDLLVNELNRSEAAEAQVSSTNDFINTMNSTVALIKRKHQALEDEYRLCRTKLTKYEEAGSSSGISVDGGNTTNDDESEPEPSYIGRYIYKNFPLDGYFVGFVVSYKKPYYRVVYEDGDMEDMVRKEVLHHWVSDSNLSAQKKIMCQRTAKSLMIAPPVVTSAPKRVQLK